MKLSFTAMLLLFSASAWAQPVQTPEPSADAAVSEITIERQGCYGNCPVYTLTLRRQGTSTYAGKRWVTRIGQFTATQLYGGDVDQLSRAVSDLGFFNLHDEYGASEDSERLAVTVTTPSQSKTVKTSDFPSAPFALWAVVTLADGVAAKLSRENPNQPKFPTITAPVPIRKIDPEYTEQARAAKLQGTVWVQVEVQPDGSVSPEHISVVHGLGMGLDEKAIEAVKQWTFRPAMRDKKPISIAMTVQVEFRL
ncbi:MAG TPA: TonB family protein [Bryobacteraceae bacterium]|jgi:TonB family protein